MRGAHTRGTFKHHIPSSIFVAYFTSNQFTYCMCAFDCVLRSGLKLKFLPHHPFNPLLSLRVASLDMSSEEQQLYTGHLLDAVWIHGSDVTDHGVMECVITELAEMSGLDGTSCVYQATTGETCKLNLRLQTDEAVSAGVFGSLLFI
jgi:2-hydroxychromene-2-carboxylate isomerase